MECDMKGKEIWARSVLVERNARILEKSKNPDSVHQIYRSADINFKWRLRSWQHTLWPTELSFTLSKNSSLFQSFLLSILL